MLVKRENTSGSNELITVYRPRAVDEICGHTINKKALKNGLRNNNLSHNFLFTGPPGCGKTTTARIIALSVNCESTKHGTVETPCLICSACKNILEGNSIDIIEINVGKSGGKDATDKTIKDLSYAPMMLRNKVVIFDEAHQLTSAAQNLLFKEIEDGFPNVYFIFCTNEPEKLKDALLDRLIPMHFGPISLDLIASMLRNICEYEGQEYTDDIITYISELSKGIPRKSISLLKKVMDEGSWDLKNIKEFLVFEHIDEDNPMILDICKELSRGSFKGALDVLKKMKTVSEEQVRIAIAGTFTNRLTRSKTFEQGDKFSQILDIVTVPIYQTGKPGRHILTNYFFKVSKIIKGK